MGEHRRSRMQLHKFASNKPKPARRIDVTFECVTRLLRTLPRGSGPKMGRREHVLQSGRSAGLGRRGFWIGASHNVTLFVFKAVQRNTNRSKRSDPGGEKVSQLRRSAELETGFLYSGQRVSFRNQPWRARREADAADQLSATLPRKRKRAIPSAVCPGNLYQFGRRCGWRRQADLRPQRVIGISRHRIVATPGSHALGIMYRDGFGLPAESNRSVGMFRKSALAGMSPRGSTLLAYAAAKTAVSGQRGTYWPRKPRSQATLPDG